jgi:hypothetical protein
MAGPEVMMIGVAAHIVGAIIWVGGLFFAFVLLPAHAESDTEWRFCSRAMRSCFFGAGSASLSHSGADWDDATLDERKPSALRSCDDGSRRGCCRDLCLSVFLPWRRFRRALATADMVAAKRQMRGTRIFAGIAPSLR